MAKIHNYQVGAGDGDFSAVYSDPKRGVEYVRVYRGLEPIPRLEDDGGGETLIEDFGCYLLIEDAFQILAFVDHDYATDVNAIRDLILRALPQKYVNIYRILKPE